MSLVDLQRKHQHSEFRKLHKPVSTSIEICYEIQIGFNTFLIMHYVWNQRLWDDMHCYIHFFSTSKSTNGHIIHEVLVLTFPLHKTLRQLTSRLQVVNNGKQKGLKSMLLKNLSLARQLSIIGCFKLKVPGVKIKN